MLEKIRSEITKLPAFDLDRRDLVAVIGLYLLGYGGESLFQGAGFAAVGAVLVYFSIIKAP